MTMTLAELVGVEGSAARACSGTYQRASLAPNYGARARAGRTGSGHG